MIRNATPADFPTILQLNEEFVDVLSPLTPERLARLDQQSALHWVVEEENRVVAFLLVFAQGSTYDGVVYSWWAARHERFLYVDRIVVSPNAPTRGWGSRLYRELTAHACGAGVPVIVCEYYSKPVNEASARFHARHGFHEVGVLALPGAEKTVSLQELVVPLPPSAPLP